jgi:hypothetical protein
VTFTPTPNPSHKGEGDTGIVALTISTIYTGRAGTGFPSPLWGGVRGGGMQLRPPPNPVARWRFRRYGIFMNAYSTKNVWWWAC